MTAYETAVRNARIYEVRLLVSLEKRMYKVLGDAYIMLDGILQKSAGSNDTIKISRTVALQHEIKQIMGDTADKISDTVKAGITDGVNIVVDSRIAGGIGILKDINVLIAGKIPSAFAHIRTDAVKAVLNRKLSDGKMFSNRIWDLKNHSGNVISDVVARGVTIGQSARDMAKEIEPYLKGYKELKEAYRGDEDFQTAWKTLRRKRGDLRYDSMRLASTEINHAEREATIQSAERAPWVLGIKWNLSLSHPKIDICDAYADRDLYGLGRGVYPPRDVPLDHPNGMCFLTDVLMPLENLKRALS